MPGRAEGGSPGHDAPICYLGTVDFIKMYPGFFDVIDSLPGEVTATGAGAGAGTGFGAAAIGGGRALGFIWVCQTNHPKIPAPNTTAKASMASSHAGRPRTAALEALAMAGLES